MAHIAQFQDIESLYIGRRNVWDLMQAKPRKYYCEPETAVEKHFIQYLWIHLADRILWDSSFTCVCNIGQRWA